MVIDELVIRLVAEGVAKTKAELLQQLKDVADAQRKLDATTDKAEARRQAAAARALKEQERDAAKALKLQEQAAKKSEAIAARQAAAAARMTEKERRLHERAAAMAQQRRQRDDEKAARDQDRAIARSLRAQEQAAKKSAALAARQGAESGRHGSTLFGGLGRADDFLTSLARTGATAVVAGFGLAAVAVRSFTKEASELETASHFTSLTTKRLQELQFAAEQNGMTAEKFRDGLRQLNAGMRESVKAGGKGAVAEAVNDLGIGFKNFIKLNPDEQIMTLIAAMNKAGPSAHRAGASAKIFGEIAGAGFARLADQGVEAFAKTAAAADEFGAVLSRESITAGVKLNQEILTLTGSLGGLSNTIAAELLPIATEWVTGLRAWVYENRRIIAVQVKEWVLGVVNVGRQMLAWLPEVVRVSREWLGILVDWAPAILASAAALKGLMIAKDIALGVQALSAAFSGATAGATGFAALLGPQGALLAGLVATIPLAEKLGSLLGDIGAATTGPRKTLTETLGASPVQVTGSFAGEGVFADELAAQLDIERQKFRRDARTIADQARREAMLRLADAADSRANARKARESEAEEFAASLSKATPKQLQAYRDEGRITEEQFNLERGRRNEQRFLGRRPDGKKKKEVTDEELAKLIASAAKSGANLDEVLKGRKIAGGVPPVITIRIFKWDVHAPITVNGKSGQSTSQLAQDVRVEFETMLEREIQKHSTEILEAR